MNDKDIFENTMKALEKYKGISSKERKLVYQFERDHGYCQFLDKGLTIPGIHCSGCSSGSPVYALYYGYLNNDGRPLNFRINGTYAYCESCYYRVSKIHYEVTK